MTLDRYSHIFPSAHEALAQKLDALHATASQEQQQPEASNVVEMRR